MNPRHPGHEHDTKPPGEPIMTAAGPSGDVNIGVLARFAIGLLVITILVSAFLIFFMKQLDRHEAAGDARVGKLAEHEWSREAEGVRLQEQPFKDVEELSKAEKQLLESSGWIDEGRGLARIRIEDAMRIVVQRGLPTRPPASGSANPAPPLSFSASAPSAPTAAAATPRPRPRPTPQPIAAPSPETAQ
jgi:hypothetical protein